MQTSAVLLLFFLIWMTFIYLLLLSKCPGYDFFLFPITQQTLNICHVLEIEIASKHMKINFGYFDDLPGTAC